MTNMEKAIYDVAIIGSGPAGLTAAIYTTRAGLKTLVLAGRFWGGQPMTTTMVENFPGFPEGIMGPDLMMNIRKQAEKFGAEILDVNFKYGNFSEHLTENEEKKPFELVTDEEKKFLAKSVIIATGAEARMLGVPGEKEKIGRGVSTCATCDAGFYRNKNVIVNGGGDSAMEEALVLARFAKHVWIVHRRDSFKASKIMQEKVFRAPEITVIYNTEIKEILGEQKVEKVLLRTKTNDKRILVRENGQEGKVEAENIGGIIREEEEEHIAWEFPIDGIFVAIGRIPTSELFKDLEKDEQGFIKTYNHGETNIEGVFVAGDVQDPKYKQSVVAAGSGSIAALEAEKWLMENFD